MTSDPRLLSDQELAALIPNGAAGTKLSLHLDAQEEKLKSLAAMNERMGEAAVQQFSQQIEALIAERDEARRQMATMRNLFDRTRRKLSPELYVEADAVLNDTEASAIAYEQRIRDQALEEAAVLADELLFEVAGGDRVGHQIRHLKGKSHADQA